MIVVFGSIHADMTFSVPALPGPGETVLGAGYQVFPGGKGANQALAARRAGGEVAMAGAVGNDSFSVVALSLLEASGVVLSGVLETPSATGIAAIIVDGKGENQIAVASGANAAANPKQLESLVSVGDILLLQSELPYDAVVGAASIGRRRGARVFLNAAPAGPISDVFATLVDVLIVNEHEAAAIASSMALPSKPQEFAISYSQRWCAIAVVTLGADGAIAASKSEWVKIQAPMVNVVDSTGAGDTFVGTLAVLFAEGASLADAVTYAVAAGSLAVERSGAQPSIPDRPAIESRVALMKEARARQA
jgi:ribokinase